MMFRTFCFSEPALEFGDGGRHIDPRIGLPPEKGFWPNRAGPPCFGVPKGLAVGFVGFGFTPGFAAAGVVLREVGLSAFSS